MARILLNVLKEAQDEHGYLSEDVLKQISVEHDVPMAHLYGMATFYLHLHTKPHGKFVIEICCSPSCILNDSTPLYEFLEQELGIKFGETREDNLFTLYKVSCIGCCDEAPAMLVNGEPYTKLTKEKIKSILEKCRS